MFDYLYTSNHASGISAKLLAYTVNEDGKEIATFKLVFHRYVAEQLLKHRMLSFNASSSRAMSVPKMNAWIDSNPAEPVFWGAQQKGMSPKEECNTLIDEEFKETRFDAWEKAKHNAMESANDYWRVGYHQQIPNRLTHAFQMASYIVTGTEWDNFFNLRLHDSNAQDEIKVLAGCIKECFENTYALDAKRTPFKWHIPYVNSYEQLQLGLKDSLVLSAARCAVVSYNNHDTDQPLGIDKAKLIYNHLLNDSNLHLSPLEHAARVESKSERKLRRQLQDLVRVANNDFDTDETLVAGNLVRAKQKQIGFYANFNGWISNRYCIENLLGVTP